MLHSPSRRELMLASGVLFAWSNLPKVAHAEGRDPRFLVVILRGALDGLATVAPVGDPEWLRLRGDDALGADGPRAGLKLDDFFVLNPAMPNLHRLYHAGQAMIVHAVATSYRERSHFDGQDVLESGFARPGITDSGWLNRTLAALAPSEPVKPDHGEAFAVGPVVPLVARGPAPVLSWTPPRLPPASEDTVMRLLELYRHTDPVLARVLEERIGFAAIARAGAMEAKKEPAKANYGPALVRAFFAQSAAAAARFMARPEGPRVGALTYDGWDTHANEGTVAGRLANLLAALDGAIAEIEAGMGSAVWRETAVAIITEFGRTARINGTEGTDHGTATVALLVGGAVRGGRVLADWPGLKEAQLHEARDLKPTTDLRAVLKGVLKDHLRLNDRTLAQAIFPESAQAKPLSGLLVA